MGVEVRPAGDGDVDALAHFWYTHMNPKHGIERWRTVARCPWYGEAPDRGWIAVDGTRIVGAMALVHSTRQVRGRTERLCNIGSLYVLKDYRGRGLARAIARDSTADESITYFGIDAAPQTRAVLEPDPVGFSVLDDRRYTWRPDGSNPREDAFALLAGRDVNLDALPASERRLFADHVSLGMYPLVIRRDGRECRCLLWIRNKHSDTRYYEAFFVSDPELFAEYGRDTAARLLHGRDAILAADTRFFHGTPPGADVESLRQPRHYKSRRLAPADVDLLYSEIPLLDLKLS